ncbi:RAP protein, putative [Plasmodium knowlesi strain H]|uniref:RAP protein, putative n=3 Tax=Plasmodium knowlesi TaxID=5850 RepID=A0A5K1VGX2_PLAKH|nr:RAP protein, putative [Plasmodium knowlesi strain H]OTN64885.1 putative RAP protein [Plasmodium knowlesi]CAA9988261.1 RAP protein, putative [Plasmodium knowlesi strain H]SBO20195.1 RAP protein, putative [Plasmodium knowlesi strain H]SBO20438.1 RAP protein, putative [Plasmodium knowlesi strain H]VVS77735.1 RAP protein, putative [Plasmodium knowlesi strain H]|eukprot:XP_002259238.1 RAP protein, putative [Plasmodium knowlesi strain H]
MFFTNVRFISKLARNKLNKRRSWIKRNKKWMLPRVEKSYLKQEQDFVVQHKTVPQRGGSHGGAEGGRSEVKSEEAKHGGIHIDYRRILEEATRKEKKHLKPHEYKKLLKQKDSSGGRTPNDDKLQLKDLLRSSKGGGTHKAMQIDIKDYKDEEKEKKKNEMNTFWYMPSPFEKKGVYGMKENSFYKSFMRDRERQLDHIDTRKLNENEKKLINEMRKNVNNVNGKFLDESVGPLDGEQKREKKIRISPRKYWFHDTYCSPDIPSLSTVKARELRFLMMNEARLVRKGKSVDVELWLAFMNRVLNLSSKVHVRSLLRYLQTIASVKVNNKKMISQIVCEIFKRENLMKPKHYVYLFQGCSRLKWSDFQLIYALKNMTLCWPILRNNFLVKSANSISKLGLANSVYSKSLQITLCERLDNFSGKNLKAIKAITFLELFTEDMILKFISLASFYKEHFNYYTRHLQVLHLYVTLFCPSLCDRLTAEQRAFLWRYSRGANWKEIRNRRNHDYSSDEDSDECSGDEESDEQSDDDSDDESDDESDEEDQERDEVLGNRCHPRTGENTHEDTKVGDKIRGGFTSMLHKEISDILTQIKVEHLNSVACGPFIVDIYHPHSNCIIEVNAPFQYYLTSEKLTTLAEWRHKFLARMGFRIIHISHKVWSSLPTDKQKVDYLSRALPAAMFGRGSPGEEYPREKYPGEKYPDEKYPDEKYPGDKYPSEEFLCDEFPCDDFPCEELPREFSL